MLSHGTWAQIFMNKKLEAKRGEVNYIEKREREREEFQFNLFISFIQTEIGGRPKRG